MVAGLSLLDTVPLGMFLGPVSERVVIVGQSFVIAIASANQTARVSGKLAGYPMQ